MEKQDGGRAGAECPGVVVSALTLKTGPVGCGLMVALALRRTVQRWERKADFSGGGNRSGKDSKNRQLFPINQGNKSR